MSIFGSIMDKIFHAGTATTETAAPSAAPSEPVAATSPAGGAAATAAMPATPPATPAQPNAPAQPVDVEKILMDMATRKGGGGNWQTSIVDLLKLLDLDASLSARKTLAEELNLHVGADGSAEENIALHKAVMQKLADNGGMVPASLKG